jgi:hypothetical protein
MRITAALSCLFAVRMTFPLVAARNLRGMAGERRRWRAEENREGIEGDPRRTAA